MKAYATQLLEQGRVTAVLALALRDGQPCPHLFDRDTIDQWEWTEAAEPRYPVAQILPRLMAQDPEARLAVVVRGCDERALIELSKLGQVQLDRVTMMGLACSRELAERCRCAQPFPSQVHAGEKVEGVERDSQVEALRELSAEQRQETWRRAFGRCIKCYGCRNVCPLCFCKQCSLQDEGLVVAGQVPPELPLFHLVRAIDVAGRCVDCGLCEEACPSGIPLRALHKDLNQRFERLFGYVAGRSADERHPLTFPGETPTAPPGED